MRALISVSDKTGVVELAHQLESLGVEIISTGGTYKRLKDNGVKVQEVSEIINFPECLDGRVKTLHPNIHGGILAMRDREDHMNQLKELNIEPIDFVIINLYPFKETIKKEGVTLEDAIENIDIGGPTMLRAAAKNYRFVSVLCDPGDYDGFMETLKKEGKPDETLNYKLALKVFQHTGAYDTMISTYLGKDCDPVFPEKLSFTYEKIQDLRYGENPHQSAAYYSEVVPEKGSLVKGAQLHGKALSFNNINDANGALELLKEFEKPAVVAVKHGNPCGVGEGYSIHDAYIKAYESDKVSIFGGIIAANGCIEEETALEINQLFVEMVVAPEFSEKALEILTTKENIRLIKLADIREKEAAFDIKKVSGGLLVQTKDMPVCEDENLQVVTSRIPTEAELKDMIFAMKVVKHVKSNGIVVAKNSQTLGVGPGQVNRIWAMENAIKQATVELKGSVVASDAFFPFSDCVEAAGKAGITAIIQPGGSIQDQASIDMANQLGIAMVFTGMRHFKH